MSVFYIRAWVDGADIVSVRTGEGPMGDTGDFGSTTYIDAVAEGALVDAATLRPTLSYANNQLTSTLLTLYSAKDINPDFAQSGFAGRQVFNWADSNFYQWNGNPWDATLSPEGVATVATDTIEKDAVDLFAGQGLSFIKSLDALPAEGDFIGQMVFLTTDGKLYEWNGTAWTLVITAVEAPDISGKLATNQIALDAVTNDLIANDAIQTENIKNLAINADKIKANAITTTKIAEAAVAAGKLATDAVANINIQTNAITETKISDDSISTPKIVAGAITAGTIATNAITSAKITAGAVTASEIATGAITAGKIASNTITANEIAAGEITSNEIAAGTITATEISAGAITTSEIGTRQITAIKIASDAITANEIASNTITGNEISGGTITGALIAGGTITGNKISANTITGGLLSTSGIITSTAQIDNGVITNAKIGNLEVGTIKIADNAVSIPVSQTRTDHYTGNGSYQEIQYVWHTMDEPGEVLILWSGGQGYSSGDTNVYHQLRVDGNSKVTRGGLFAHDTAVLVYSMYLSAGTRKFSVFWEADSTVTHFSRTMSILGVMK